VEELRRIYAERERRLNPTVQEPWLDLNKLEDSKGKIEHLEERIKALEERKTNSSSDVKIVTSEEDLVSLSKLGYKCQTIGVNRWPMKRNQRKSRGGMRGLALKNCAKPGNIESRVWSQQ
jgi:hypothetical protein